MMHRFQALWLRFFDHVYATRKNLNIVEYGSSRLRTAVGRTERARKWGWPRSGAQVHSG
jgi:hypothetical protein